MLKSQSLKSIVITFCKKRLSCDRVIKRGLGNLNSRAVFEILDIFC